MNTKVTEPQAAKQPDEGDLRERLAETLYDGATILAYSVGHDIGELADIVTGLAGRGIMLVPAVGNAPMFATAKAVAPGTNNTDQAGIVVVTHRFSRPTATIDRGELTTEAYIEALAAAVEGGES